ncbi:MAG: hypothetical protein ACD_63C00180G0003 [uncultured bacterium]|nr:MAG: hypothetical protein ACD_63C00180G0003 [uncultured bacterium]
MRDIVIIGTGAAGMTAAIYAARYNLKAVLLIGEKRGGTATEASEIENYPGFKKITGLELMEKFREHVQNFDIKIIDQKVSKVQKKDSGFLVEVGDDKFEARTLVLALGTNRRRLGVPGEAEFTNKGVAYCATCDAPFFKGKTVAVVGGGNSATMSATLLTQYCPKVYMIIRGDKLRGEPIWIDRVNSNERVEIIYNTNVKKISGTSRIEKLELDNPYNGNKDFPIDGLFIEIGSLPANELARQLGIKLNKQGRIIVDSRQMTSLEGVFAAGDITDKTGDFEQVVNSCAQGAKASYEAFQFLQDKG